MVQAVGEPDGLYLPLCAGGEAFHLDPCWHCEDEPAEVLRLHGDRRVAVERVSALAGVQAGRALENDSQIPPAAGCRDGGLAARCGDRVVLAELAETQNACLGHRLRSFPESTRP